MGMPADTVALVKQAAPLHDVGKIGVPDSILLRPGRLTPEEFALMKRHTVIGSNLLGGCPTSWEWPKRSRAAITSGGTARATPMGSVDWTFPSPRESWPSQISTTR